MISAVIWDFNGTLLNDVDLAVASVNDTLTKLDLPLTNREEYRRNMDMPITKYYEKHMDLTKVSFDFLSKEYLAGFEKHHSLLKPSKGALEAVKELHMHGVRQCVVSSFEQTRLESLLSEFGFLPYLEGVSGALDTKCESKVQRGVSFLCEQNIDPENALVVGDLVHDFELAQALGAKCLLFSLGHQPAEKLKECGVPIIDDLREVLKYE